MFFRLEEEFIDSQYSQDVFDEVWITDLSTLGHVESII